VTRTEAIENLVKKVNNCEVTPHVMWPMVKCLIKRNGPKAQTTIHGPLGLKFVQSEKSNAISDCLDVPDEDHERRVEARVQAMLEAIENNPSERLRPCDQKLIQSLNLRNACGIDGIPNECLRHLPRWPLVHLTPI
jgi:hypothetical protein